MYEAQILATLEPLLAAQSRVFSILEQFTKYLLEIGILGPGFEPSLRAVFTTWDKLFEWIERLVKGRVACLEGFVSAGLPELQLQWNMRFGVYSRRKNIAHPTYVCSAIRHCPKSPSESGKQSGWLRTGAGRICLCHLHRTTPDTHRAGSGRYHMA